MYKHAFFALLAVGAGVAFAASDSAPEDGRFTMTPVENGFLRLDTRSGHVSLCTVKEGAAECRLAADERAALLDEIDRLRKGDKRSDGSRNLLPNRQDLEQVWETMEEFMRRMMRTMREETDRR
jgi:hypothetical protein